MLDAGVERVVIGSLAVSDPAAFAAMLDRFGPDRLTLALDVRIESGEAMVATHGWEVGSGRTLGDVLGAVPGGAALAGHRHRPRRHAERAQPRPDADDHRRLSRRSSCRRRAASPTSPTLPRSHAAGAARAIVGKAIWEGRFTVARGVAHARG